MEELLRQILAEQQKTNHRLENLELGFKNLEARQENLETGFKKLEKRQENLEAGQVRIENKIDKLATLQSDDIVVLVKTTSEIKQTVNRMQKDVLYLVERTVDNSKQILELVK